MPETAGFEILLETRIREAPMVIDRSSVDAAAGESTVSGLEVKDIGKSATHTVRQRHAAFVSIVVEGGEVDVTRVLATTELLRGDGYGHLTPRLHTDTDPDRGRTGRSGNVQ